MEPVLGFALLVPFTVLLTYVAAAVTPTAPRRTRILLAVATGLVAVDVGITGYLAQRGLVLLADGATIALVPALVALGCAPPLGRPAPWRVRTAAAAALVHLYLAVFDPPTPPYLAGTVTMVGILGAAAGIAWGWDRRYGGLPRRGLRWAVAAGVAVGLVTGGVVAARTTSLLPAELNLAAHESGHGSAAEHGGHPSVGHGHGNKNGGTDIRTLTGPRDRTPDRRFTLTAQRATVTLASGEVVDAWTFNGTLPGPTLRVRAGELVEVTLVNRDIDAGATVHWHGLDVPNAEDGVAGLTQDAVRPGGSHVYRFVAHQVGSFWYHSHQQSAEQVRRGMFGALIVEPTRRGVDVDLAAVTHTWHLGKNGEKAVTGMSIDDATSTQRPPTTAVTRRATPPGSLVRLRLVNADNAWRTFVLSGAVFRVTAVDGTDLNAPRDVSDRGVHVAGGGRADLVFRMPATPVQLTVAEQDEDGGANSPALLFAKDGELQPSPPRPRLDLLSYGAPTATPFGAGSRFDRRVSLVIGHKLAFYDGQFDLLNTINGAVHPHVAPIVVRRGELIHVTFVNRSFDSHPMHLHGHHILVLSRNGVPSRGTPWWSDTLNVQPGERYEVAFRADNPGLWMDHCHNLDHAAMGMTMHLVYDGHTTPFRVGRKPGNLPE